MRTFVVVMIVSYVGMMGWADPVAAQGRGSSNRAAAEEAAACGSCGAGCGILLLVPVALLALNIALLIWVARDAKSRGMDSAVSWMALVMFTGPIGLIIYIMSRPQGNLTLCEECGNRRLQASKRCPHCGNT